MFYGDGSASVEHQPKGVIRNISPWNFPFDLSVGPLVDMLAAGNRVMIKPSEFTPACSELLREMVAAAFDPDLVHVVTGGVDVAKAFAATRWDHLLYTGSADVGRQIMRHAAENLTPVTLELGGKSPALLTPGSVDHRNVEAIIGTKLIKSGQMCIAPDYALLPRADVEAFIGHAQAVMAQRAPMYASGEDCTGIISSRHLERLSDMLKEAQDRQCRIVAFEDHSNIGRATRCMPLTLVINPPPDARLMREEVFGPILPVIPYDSLDEAIDRIDESDRPLGLYVFGHDDGQIEGVLTQTASGGACVNTCAVQGAIPSLGFGGSGANGMGRHHGVAGFREFSNERGVFRRGTGDLIYAFFPPYAKAAGIVNMVLGGNSD